jgi:hypothetical protein
VTRVRGVNQTIKNKWAHRELFLSSRLRHYIHRGGEKQLGLCVGAVQLDDVFVLATGAFLSDPLQAAHRGGGSCEAGAPLRQRLYRSRSNSQKFIFRQQFSEHRPLSGRTCEAAAYDAVELGCQLGGSAPPPQQPHPARAGATVVGLHHRHHYLGQRISLERVLQRAQLVRDAAQRPHVRHGSVRAARHQLWAEVMGRPDGGRGQPTHTQLLG